MHRSEHANSEYLSVCVTGIHPVEHREHPAVLHTMHVRTFTPIPLFPHLGQFIVSGINVS
jgi:hypothetical protein